MELIFVTVDFCFSRPEFKRFL